MPAVAPPPPARFPTVVRSVSDIALTGFAVAEPWRPLLEAAHVHPFLDDGRVELALLACSAKYKGKRFRELSLSVAISNADDASTRDGVYLATAFNSVRFFAWVERVFFKTPYAHADVRLLGTPATGFEVRADDQAVVCASKGPGEHPGEPGDALWEGPIHLPPKRAGAGPRCFFGRLEGESTRYAYDAARDRIAVRPRSTNDPLALLETSEFRPASWQVRTGAVHARTKTIRLG